MPTDPVLAKRVQDLQDTVSTMAQALEGVINKLNELERAQNKENVQKNKDGIPIGTHISAEVKEGDIILETERTGYRLVKVGNQDVYGGTKFKSLSAAAEAVSGISRKSGWIFWRDFTTGKTLKELYKG